MATNDSFVKRHSVVIYFALTLLISWGALLLIMGLDGFLGTAEVPAELMPLLYVGMLLGPSIAGLLMIGLVEGRAGYAALLERLRRARLGAIWYLIALLTAPVLATLALLLLSQFSTAYAPVILTSADKAGVLITGLVAGILVGIFEEIGWTGFAIPRLRLSHGILATGLIVGLVWGLWHAPLFVSSARASQTVPPIVTLLVLLFTFLPAFRVLMVWVYEHTQSLLLAMLMHFAQTATTLIFALSATDVEGVTFNLVYTAFLCVFLALIGLAGRGKLGAQVGYARGPSA